MLFDKALSLFWQNDGLHFRQPWVKAVQEDVERLKLRLLDYEKLQRECEALKVSLYLTLLIVLCTILIGLYDVCPGRGEDAACTRLCT